MDTQAPVLACSNCSALYTAAPGDRGMCVDCRRRPPVPQRETTQPFRVTAPMTTSRPTPTDTKRPLFPRRARKPLPRGIVPTVIALAAVGLLATQRQRLSETAKWVQRHGVEGTWKFVEHKASQLWASIRRDVQSGISDAKHASATPATPSRTPSHDSATRGTHRRTQLASGTKRKSGSRQRDDIGTPGSTP